ncbi:hypothetical protein JRQ81_017194 [Phrynocephalus forsythii]|uniref:Tumor necrosis factor receptor superfamily member 6 n=1 Tax=Phrynocephalus forsythii TaxID=171643 RepID=A0A9Q0XT62_9SAUR|nr:hypothetical protein JRQ81_017194 [Phrynocephalus forsythii]
MVKSLLLCLFTACGLSATGLSHNNDAVPVTHTVYNKLAGVRRVSKRNVIDCHDNTKYLFNASFGVICCESCPPGYVAATIGCTKEDNKTRCKKCTQGEDYMDHYNYNTKCLRCSGCDGPHGMEVEENCTINQNTKCKCVTDHFCDSAPCRHCTPCDTCANGRVLEPCKETKNTQCEETGQTRQHTVIYVIIFIVLGILVVSFLVWKKLNNKQKTYVSADVNPGNERNQLIYPDIDLSPHLAAIAEEMNLDDVRRFVRKLRVSPSRIDAVRNDNQNNATEEKIKLLELWYQENGITGAYGTLITTLRKLHLRSTADRIEQTIQAVLIQS